jgi:hypothetical protein
MIPQSFIETHRHTSRPTAFCAALAIAVALYGQRILATWADRTESELAVVCLMSKKQGTDTQPLIAELEKSILVREARLVKPDEVASWISKAVQASGTTVTLSAAQLPSAIELQCRGAVRRPKQFAQMLEAVGSNPAFERVFFDAAGQQRAARFYASAWRAIDAFLAAAWIGALVAGIGAALGQKSPATSGLPPVGLSLSHHPPTQSGTWNTSLAILRALAPAALGWLCVFVILAIWPILSPPGLGFGAHLFVLGATIVFLELASLCAALVGRFLV